MYEVISFILLCFILSRISLGDAFSTYAGTCGSGKSISLSNGAHGQEGQGNIIVGDLALILNNDRISEFEFNTETITILDTDIDYSIKLTGVDNANNVSFKGFLIRLEAKEKQNISTALQLNSENIQFHPLSTCSNNNNVNVEALTHTSNIPKSEVEFALNFEEGGDYQLEVTIVASRTTRGSNDWYYSLFDIRVELNESATAPPTKKIASTNTLSPSTIQTTTNTSEEVLSNFPSESPGILPVSTDIASPSNVPTNAIMVSQNPTAMEEKITEQPSESTYTTQKPSASPSGVNQSNQSESNRRKEALAAFGSFSVLMLIMIFVSAFSY